MTALEGIGQDLILTPEACEGHDPGQGQVADRIAPEGPGHPATQPTHIANILGALLGGIRILVVQCAHCRSRLHCVDDRARAQEEQCLEEGMGEEMEHARNPAANAQGSDHKPQLRQGTVGEDALDIILGQRDRCRKEGGECANSGNDSEGGTIISGEDGEGTCHQKDPRRDHRCRVDQGRNWGWALHCIREPDVEGKLGTLADRATEDQEGNRGCVAQPEEARLRSEARQECRVEDCTNFTPEGQAPRLGIEVDETEQQEHITDACGNKGLDRSSIGLGPFVEEANQQVGAEAHHLPGHEEEQQVISHRHEQHRCGKERNEAEEAALARVPGHIAQTKEVNAG